MNSQNKIYNLEITPPAGVWDFIAKELDEIESNKLISEKLNALNVAPPEFLWKNIEAELDNQNTDQKISEKLYNLETTPPVLSWENISRELDDQRALEIIEKKLKHLQIQPPAAAWINIQHELKNPSSERKGIVVPMNHNSWLKYAAAACFIAIIGITGYFIFKDSSDTGQQFASNQSGKPFVAASKNEEENINTKPVIPPQESQKEKAIAAIRTSLGNAYSISNERNTELQNRYIILMTPDGNIVRMSKKVSNMADCIAGEDNSCDAKISEWQKEMANNKTIAAPAGFLDILDMAGSQEENN